MGPEVTAEDVEAAVGRLDQEAPAETVFVCDECGREFASENALNGHLSAHRGKPAGAGKSRAAASRERPKTPPAKLAGIAGEARSIVNKAVANTQTIGAFLMMVAPHTGLAIAGLRDPNSKRVIVRSRAEVAGEILLGQIASATSSDEIERAARIVELLRRYNSMFDYSAIGDLAGSIAVAAAIDARFIRPDFKVKVGQFELPIVQATIGDVVAELEREGLYAEAPADEAEAPAGPPAEGPETIEGPVEAT